MSKALALKAIQLQMPEKIPHWEMISHPELERAVTGIDPYLHPQQSKLRMIERLHLAVDTAPLDDEPVAELPGEYVRGGARPDRVRWGTGSTWSWRHKTASSLDDLWAFEPMRELWRQDCPYVFEDLKQYQPLFGLPQSRIEQEVARAYDAEQSIVGDRCLVLAGYYRTLIMWVLMLFDWDLFLEGVALYPKKMGELLDRFGEMNLLIYQALARTEAPLIASHDDICMTNGPICSPEFYRRYVYPWYERLWSVLKLSGKKVIFFSDGNVDKVADDIFACGADGIYGEPYTDLRSIAERYGQTKILWGNLDNRILMSGDREAIRREVDRCTSFGRACPGYFYGVTNHLPWNVPVDSIRYYFEYSAEAGIR